MCVCICEVKACWWSSQMCHCFLSSSFQAIKENETSMTAITQTGTGTRQRTLPSRDYAFRAGNGDDFV